MSGGESERAGFGVDPGEGREIARVAEIDEEVIDPEFLVKFDGGVGIEVGRSAGVIGLVAEHPTAVPFEEAMRILRDIFPIDEFPAVGVPLEGLLMLRRDPAGIGWGVVSDPLAGIEPILEDLLLFAGGFVGEEEGVSIGIGDDGIPLLLDAVGEPSKAG